MLNPYLESKQIELFLETKVISAETDNDMEKAVIGKNLKTKEKTRFTGTFFIDGTDIGSLLPLTNTEYVTGAESKAETNEPHAPLEASKYDMQPVTWVAAIEFAKGENHTIEKPPYYDYFNSVVMDFAAGVKKLSWEYPGLKRGQKERGSLFGHEGINLFTYRRIINSAYITDDYVKNDVTILNWPHNDYHFGNIYESPDAEHHYMMAKELTKSVVNRMLTEAPRVYGL